MSLLFLKKCNLPLTTGFSESYDSRTPVLLGDEHAITTNAKKVRLTMALRYIKIVLLKMKSQRLLLLLLYYSQSDSHRNHEIFLDTKKCLESPKKEQNS